MTGTSNYWEEALRRRLSRRALLRRGAYAGLGLASLSAAGCGGSQAKPAVGPQTGAEQPQSGGILTYSIAGDPPNFDLISQSTYMMQHPMAPVYNNLVMFDPMDANKIIPELAEKWTISPDGKVYTFNLVKGVKFHDGKPCTSADVKYTLDIVRDPSKGIVSPRQTSFGAVDGIETPDDYTVRIVLKRPAPSLLANLAQGWMGIMPKHILQEKGNMEKDAVGTGPFKFKEYSRGNYVELVKNPDYHVKGRPYLDGIKFFIIPDPGTALANFRTGQLLWHQTIASEEAEIAQKDFGDKVTITNIPSTTNSSATFNVSKKPWDDIRVRQAVSLSIDRAEGVKVVVRGYGDVAGVMPPKGAWALPAAELEKIPGYGKDTAANIAQAKKLLAEAGYPNGFATTLLTRKGTSFEPFSVFLKDQMAKIGIDAKLDVQETAKSYDMLNNKAFDLGPWVATVANDDPDAFFGEFWACNALRNYSGLCIKEVDDLYTKQSQTVNLEERKKLVWELEKTALLSFNWVVLYFSRRFLGLNNRVHGYKQHSSIFNNQRLQDVWLSQS